MAIDMSQFFQVFFEETEELLTEKEKLLLAIDVADPSMDDIDAIFRAAHSIKGGAATFGLTDMTEVTHILESLLDKIRKGEMSLTAEHVDVFLSANDILRMLRDGHRDGAAVDQDAVNEVLVRLASLSEKAASQPSLPSTGSNIQSVAAENASLRLFHIGLPEVPARDVEALAAELGLLGAIEQAIGEDGKLVLHLKTSESRDDILAICSFILDPDDLVITESAASAVPEPEASSRNDASDDDRGYGFFDNIELPAIGRTEKPIVLQEGEIHPAPCGDSSSTMATEVKKQVRQSAAKAPVNQESTSIRVNIDKVDQMINLVGELVITQAMIEQRTSMLDSMAYQRLLDSVAQLTRNTRDLQQAVMSIRMMPMDYVFSRFPRMVRDLAGKLGKRVDFITQGAATELDKGLIERIIDPLTHLVRNSVDHGIEMPEARIAAGKSEVGKLTLSATHQGGHIIIEVTDDGGGLNEERILAKARQQGLPVSDNMTDSEIWHLIFAPGFSTAEAVTDVSGRGVGMDVVKRNITAMGGYVEIHSAKGLGTTITIFLPLTLAILDGMSIKVGEEVFILPLGYVAESLQPDPADIKEIAGRGRVVKVRGEYLPLIALYQLFAIEPHFTDPTEGIVVILEAEGNKAALFIDELLGQQHVVVKNLESNYRKVAGISGATIMGDGGVALILDVPSILRSNRQQNSNESGLMAEN
jgi:two-component system chemotaxis sensor kinase CheA